MPDEEAIAEQPSERLVDLVQSERVPDLVHSVFLVHDVYAVEDSVSRLGSKVQSNHFFKIKARKLASMSDIADDNWQERLTDALQILSDVEKVQSVVTAKEGQPYVFLRHWTTLHLNVCAPMYSCDVEAICAMVGGKGLSELEAIPRAQLSDLRRHGCKSPALQECFQRVLANYTEAGSILPDDPSQIDGFVDRAANKRALRREKYEEREAEVILADDSEEDAVARAETTEARPGPEPDEDEDEDEDETACPRCEKARLHNGNQVCEACITELLQLEIVLGPERAVALDRRGGGKVKVGGMILEPERIRRLLGRAVRVTREIQNTMLPPLTDELDDDEEPLTGRDRERSLHQIDARVSDLRSILSSLRAEFVEDTDHASRLSQFSEGRG